MRPLRLALLPLGIALRARGRVGVVRRLASSARGRRLRRRLRPHRVRRRRLGTTAGEPRRRAHVAGRLHVVPRHRLRARALPPSRAARPPPPLLPDRAPADPARARRRGRRVRRRVRSSRSPRNDVVTLALSGAVAARPARCSRTATGPARKAAGLALAAALAFAACSRSVPSGGWPAGIADARPLGVRLRDRVRGDRSPRRPAPRPLGRGGRHRPRRRPRRARADRRPFAASSLARSAIRRSSSATACRTTGGFVDEAGRPRRAAAARLGQGRARRSRTAASGSRCSSTTRRSWPTGTLVESVAAAARIAVANAASAGRGAGARRTSSRRRAAASSRPATRSAAGSSRSFDWARSGGSTESRRSLADARNAAAPTDAAAIGALENELDEARRELREFAQGVHPAALTERRARARARRCSPSARRFPSTLDGQSRAASGAGRGGALLRLLGGAGQRRQARRGLARVDRR